jgi:hypothetical protein
MGSDYYTESQGGSVKELSDVFQTNGIQVSVSRQSWDKLHDSFLEKCFLVWYNIATVIFTKLGLQLEVRYQQPWGTWNLHFHVLTRSRVDSLSGKHIQASSTSDEFSSSDHGLNEHGSQSTGSPAQTGALTSPGASTSFNHQPSGQSSPTPASTTSVTPSIVSIRDDFILLCFQVGKYLTRRHDLNVMGMTQDSELFDAFRHQYKSRTRWTKRLFSLQTVRAMKFVEVSIHTSLPVLHNT